MRDIDGGRMGETVTVLVEEIVRALEGARRLP